MGCLAIFRKSQKVLTIYFVPKGQKVPRNNLGTSPVYNRVNFKQVVKMKQIVHSPPSSSIFCSLNKCVFYGWTNKINTLDGGTEVLFSTIKVLPG